MRRADRRLLFVALVLGGCELATGRLPSLELPPTAAGAGGVTTIVGTSRDDAWARVGAGELYHLEGDTWRLVGVTGLNANPVPATPGSCWVILGSFPARLVRIDASGAELAAPTGLPDMTNASLASFDGELFVIAFDPTMGNVPSAFRVSGDVATPLPAPPPEIGAWVLMTSRDEAWASGGIGVPGLFHFDGTTWTAHPELQPTRSFVASGPDDVWAAQEFASLLFDKMSTDLVLHHWDGTRWTTLGVPPPEIDDGYIGYGLAMAGPGQVEVIGGRGVVFGQEGGANFRKVLVTHRFDGTYLVGGRDQTFCNQHGCGGTPGIFPLADGDTMLVWNGRIFHGGFGEP